MVLLELISTKIMARQSFGGVLKGILGLGTEDQSHERPKNY